MREGPEDIEGEKREKCRHRFRKKRKRKKKWGSKQRKSKIGLKKTSTKKMLVYL